MNTIFITKRQLALLLLALTTTFNACKKEDVVKDPQPTVRPHLTSLEDDANSYLIFGYTNDGFLNKFKMVNPYLTSESHFGYNDAKKPIAGTWDGFDLAFTYNGNLLDKVTFEAATPTPLRANHYLKFTYQNGRVSQTIDYVKQGENYRPAAKHVYAYYANGDMKSETYYYLVALPDDFEQLERNVYEYDDKINAVQMPDEIAYTLYLNKSAHNIKKITTYDASGSLEETKSYSLNYNKFGQPTTGVENTTYPDGPGTNRSLLYSYQ